MRSNYTKFQLGESEACHWGHLNSDSGVLSFAGGRRKKNGSATLDHEHNLNPRRRRSRGCSFIVFLFEGKIRKFPHDSSKGKHVVKVLSERRSKKALARSLGDSDELFRSGEGGANLGHRTPAL